MRIVRMTSSCRANATPAVRRPRQQRCAVRVAYSPNRTPGQWYAHGRYVEREGGTTTGLAKVTGPSTWDVRPDFLSILRAMKKATDRQRMLHGHAAAISPPPPDSVHADESDHGPPMASGGHAMDETTGVVHMILEGNGQKIHLIPHDKVIESAHRSGGLTPKTEIQLRRRAGTVALVPSEKKERTRGRAR